MIVNNAIGISGQKCEICKTWINHYNNFAEIETKECFEINYTNTDIDGVHVNKIYGKTLFIVPHCKSMHHKPELTLEIL